MHVLNSHLTIITEELLYRCNKLLYLLHLIISNFWIREDLSLENETGLFRDRNRVMDLCYRPSHIFVLYSYMLLIHHVVTV